MDFKCRDEKRERISINKIAKKQNAWGEREGDKEGNIYFIDDGEVTTYFSF